MGGGGTGSGGGISLGGAGVVDDLRTFLAGGLDVGGESDSADAACRKSVPFIAAGDSARCEKTAAQLLPLGFGENIADAVIFMGGVGEPKDRLRRRGESRGGTVPRGFGENIADAIMDTGEEISIDENALEAFTDEPEPVGGRCIRCCGAKRVRKW